MRVYIERSPNRGRNRIHLFSEYSTAVVARCKTIVGGSILKEHGRFKCWSFPLDIGNCFALRAQFGNDLDIGPELWKWAEAENERQDGLQDLLNGAQGVCPLVEVQEPKLASAFAHRPFQATGAAFLAQAKYALCGDDPGLGKTLETFGAVVEAGFTEGAFLVFCPSSAVRSTWQREIESWMPEHDIAIPCDGTRGQRLKAFEKLNAEWQSMLVPKRFWFICNIDMCRTQYSAVCPGPTKREAKLDVDDELPDACDGDYVGCRYKKRHKREAIAMYPGLFDRDWDAIIIDESHKALITTTSRKTKQSQKRVGFGMLRQAPGGMRTLLSGTPWRGKPLNFWGSLNWLRSDLYPGKWRWAEKFFEVSSNGFGNVIGDFKPGMEEEWNRELRSVMIRRTKAEVAPDLKPKEYAGTHLNNDTSLPKGVWLEMEPAQAKLYRKFAAEAVVRLEGGTMFGNGLLSEMGRLRQFATSGLKIVNGDVAPALPSNKFSYICDFLEARGIMGDIWGDKKVIISSNYTQTLNLFRELLRKKGVESHIITGDVPTKQRARQVAHFQSDTAGPRVFFLNTQAGGVSLTLDAADDVVKIDRSWDPDDDTQLEDRAHRVSRTDHQVTVFNLYSLGTIDEQIALVADTREDIQKKFLDGARGVAFALKLLRAESTA